MTDLIKQTATTMLGQSPGAVVRYRLLRDVLRKSPDSAELLQAKDNLKHSRCIKELVNEQRANGGWGAFHSANTRAKQKVPTTEIGVERALALGLSASHPILREASAHIQTIMRGETEFPDSPEKNDRWPIGMRLFLASTLSLIHPDHPVLSADRELWHEIARRSFQSGEYSERDEVAAHADLTGATVRDSYLTLNGKYQLNILGSVPAMLPEELETALLRWLWSHPDGIGYLGIQLDQPPPTKPGPFDRWLTSIELLSRLFPGWRRLAHSSIEWLREHRNEQGYWDFGPRPAISTFFPLSDNWRSRHNRVFDWTTRVLILLRKYQA